LLFQLDACVLGFEHLKALYDKDEDFGELYADCSKHPKRFSNPEGISCQGYTAMCTKVYHQVTLIREVHGGSLASNYRENMTVTMLREHYYWPSTERVFRTYSRGVEPGKWLKVIPYPPTYTHLYLFPLHLGLM